jgi:O-antigen ligase
VLKQFTTIQINFFYAFAIASILCVLVWLASGSILPLGIPFAILLGAILVYDFRIVYAMLLLAIPISINLLEFGLMSIDVPDEPLMLLLTAAFPFIFIINKKYFFDSKFFKNPLVFIIVVYFIWMIICTINSTNMVLSTKFLLSKIWYVIPFVAITSLIVYSNTNYILKIGAYLIAALVPMIIFITYRHSTLGFTFEDVTNATAPYFRNHVLYGSMISMFIPMIIAGILLCKKFSKSWWLLLFCLVVHFVGVYLAYSRGAWAALFFALGIMVAMRFKIVQWCMILFFVAFGTAAIFLSTNNKYLDFAPKYETGIMHDNLVDHLIATIKGKDISSNERFYRWVAAARMAKFHPICGVGPNTFYENYKPHTVTLFRTYVSRNEEQSTSHNYFLFMLVEQGWVGLIIYCALIFLIFYRAQVVYCKLPTKQLRIMLMGTTCMLGAFFMNNFLSELIEVDKVGSLFFIGIGIIIALDIKYHNAYNNSSSKPLPAV